MSDLNIPNACSTSANEPVGTTSLAAASCNLSHLDRIANSTDPTSTNRVGVAQGTVDALSNSFGFIIAGDFSTGFTIQHRNQVGQATNGTIWRYSGSLPFTVPANTAPTSPTYVQLVETDHNNLTNRNAAASHSSAAISTTDGDLNASLANRIECEFNSDDKHFISSVPRVGSNGVVTFVNDADHETLGFDSVSQIGDFIIRVDYTDDYEQVNNLSVTVDDALAKYGVYTGGNVGVSFSTFISYTQLRGQVDTTGTGSFVSTGLLPDGNVNVSYVNDVLIIDHDEAAFTQDSAVVTQVYALSFMTDFGVSQNASQINIIPYTKLAGAIEYDGTNFVNIANRTSTISSTQTGITYEWDGTVNALKVNHPLAKDSIVNVNSELGGVTAFNVEVNSLTSFRVYFFDASNTQITTPATSMKINFSRPSCQVRGIIPTGAKFNLRAGTIPIRSAALGSASGNNFWVNGVMQKKL